MQVRALQSPVLHQVLGPQFPPPYETVSGFCGVLSAPFNPSPWGDESQSWSVRHLHQRRALDWGLSVLVTDECCLLRRPALVSGQWESLSIS